jgi:hypothetical protein
MPNLPSLVLSRKPRRPGDPRWNDAPSWFGGRPALGGNAWPRASGGRPMTFVAQVNLEEIARTAGPSVLPSRGALAFFIGGDPGDAGGAAILVEHPGAPTDPPPDAPAAYERGGEIFPANADPAAPRTFPRWPLEITPVPELAAPKSEDDEDDEWGKRVLAALDHHFRRRQFFLSASHAWEELGVAAPPVWWHSAQLFAEYLKAAERHLPARIEQHRGWVAAARAQVEKLRPPAPRGTFGRRQAEPTPQLKSAEDHVKQNEAKVRELQSQAPAFSAFVAEVVAWTRRADPWTQMQAEDVARLKEAYERSHGHRSEFGEIASFRIPSRLDDIGTETLLAMMTGDERAFAAMPEPMREHINRSYLLPTQAWHQMFGTGVDIQGNAAVENEGNVMLLQLVYDDMIGWRFGDMGAFQFWIPPADLAAGRWKAVRVTFEMG